MNLEDYKNWQPKFFPKWVKTKSLEPVMLNRVNNWSILEMCGESGEVLELAQKATRKEKDIDIAKLKDELSDVFWGLTAIMNNNGWTYEEIAEYNYNKLEERNKG